MMIKPPIKTNLSKLSISSWIIEKFPQSYQEMRYIEPFVNNGSILLNKIKSKEEVVGDSDQDVVLMWRIIRDENKNLKSKISKLSYNEKHFNSLINKKNDDDSKKAFLEFALRKMSKNGQKQIFDPIERKKANKFWKEVCDNLSITEERIKNVYFISKTPLEIIENFDNPDTLCFCCPPPNLGEDNSIMKQNDYFKLTDLLKAYKGKVVFCGNNCSFYKRVFSEWKIIKNKIKKNDLLWVNF